MGDGGTGTGREGEGRGRGSGGDGRPRLEEGRGGKDGWGIDPPSRSLKGHGAVFILVAQARALATCFRSPLAPNPNPQRLFPAMGSPGGGGLEAATPKAPRHQATAKIAKEALA